MAAKTVLREAIDLAELKLQLQTAESAVNAAKRLLGKLDTELDPIPAAQNEGVGGIQSSSEDRLIPVVDWPRYHPWPKVSGLRHLIFHARDNGFNQAVRRIGDRVLISEKAFFEWAEGQNGHTPRAGARANTVERSHQPAHCNNVKRPRQSTHGAGTERSHQPAHSNNVKRPRQSTHSASTEQSHQSAHSNNATCNRKSVHSASTEQSHQSAGNNNAERSRQSELDRNDSQ